MQIRSLTHYSPALGKDMHMMIYGRDGIPFLAFPTQDGMCRQLEDFGVIDQLSDFLESGKIQLFVVDSVDQESWSARGADNAWRSARQEQYFHYIVEEVVPLIREYNDIRPITMGMSMGANHAAITFLRRPDLFRGMLALSGVFDTDYFFDGYMDPTLYESSPERFLPNMPADHEYVKIYNRKKIIFCIGQGAWEDDGLGPMRFLQQQFERLGVRAWFDYWGYDVNHDWPWWYKQLRYFIPSMLAE